MFKIILKKNKFKLLKTLSLKLLALTLLIGMSSAGLSGVGNTMGYYNDIESSTENTFVAGSVDFLLEASDWQPTETAVSMAPGDITKKTVKVDPQDSNPFQYYTELNNETGDPDFCAGLNVVATLDGEEIYDGPIADFLTTKTIAKISPDPKDSWEFTYTTSTTDFQNKICDFDIDYNGWQTRHDFPTYEDGGFSDTEKVSNHISSWGFRINKVYYDVAPSRGVEGVNEWVEIYNQTNTPLDISGWQICDNNSCDTLPVTPAIPALKYAVIVADPNTGSSIMPSDWYFPSEVTPIILSDGLIGDGLDNDADMLTLKRSDGVIVDQMNWGNPDTIWANYNANVWNPGVEGVEEGNLLARVPSGHDTDTPSDWTELIPPSVNLLYPDEGGSYTWYWGYSYQIRWTAINNNGDDGDLNISLFYVKDVNYDGVINAGDTTHSIIETTTNDGSYNWTVPSGFLGYIWVYIVATGPENPMLNSGTVSGRIYDPIPIFVEPGNLQAPELPIEDIAEPTEEIITEEIPAVVPEENNGDTTIEVPETEIPDTVSEENNEETAEIIDNNSETEQEEVIEEPASENTGMEVIEEIIAEVEETIVPEIESVPAVEEVTVSEEPQSEAPAEAPASEPAPSE